MSAVATGGRTFEIDEVFKQTFRVLRRRWLRLGACFLMTLVLIGIGVALASLGLAGISNLPIALIGGFFAAAIYLLDLAVVMRVAAVEVLGLDESFGASIKHAMAALLPMILVWIISWMAVVVGLVFLVVPGIMIGVALIAAVPARINEPIGGIFGAFTRSAELTRGARWPVFALLLVYWALNFAFNLASSALGGQTPFWLGAILLIIQVLFGLIVAPVAWAALYCCLKIAREGRPVAAVADVFT